MSKHVYDHKVCLRSGAYVTLLYLIYTFTKSRKSVLFPLIDVVSMLTDPRKFWLFADVNSENNYFLRQNWTDATETKTVLSELVSSSLFKAFIC